MKLALILLSLLATSLGKPILKTILKQNQCFLLTAFDDNHDDSNHDHDVFDEEHSKYN
jgi:hypothetical protein